MSHKYTLTTTLRELGKHESCRPAYNKLAATAGDNRDIDTEINLLDILDACGVDDMLLCSIATKEPSAKAIRLIVADIAESVFRFIRYPSIIEKSRLCIDLCRDFSVSKDRLRDAANFAYSSCFDPDDHGASAARAAYYAAYSASFAERAAHGDAVCYSDDAAYYVAASDAYAYTDSSIDAAIAVRNLAMRYGLCGEENYKAIIKNYLS